MKTAVIVNPASGNGTTGRRWPAIARALEKEGVSFAHQFTAGPGDATGITRRFLREGYNLVVSVGGDGTLNEVVNGFFSSGKTLPEGAALGLIPSGTGRDFARTAGIPGDPAAAAGIIKNCLSPREIDVGRVTYSDSDGRRHTRHFVNIAGLGFDAFTAARVNRTSKALGGFASFLWGTLISLILYRNQEMTISVDGRPVISEPVTTVVIANGRYFGGGMQIAPHARFDDGLFEIIVLRDLGKLNLLANLPRVYRGTHLGHPRITRLQGSRVTVFSPGVNLLNLDGEQPGQGPVTIELIPRAIRLLSMDPAQLVPTGGRPVA